MLTRRTTDRETVVWTAAVLVQARRRERAPKSTAAPGFSATLSLSRIGSRDRFRDQALEVPQTRSITRGVVAEIEVGGAVQTSVSNLQPDRLIHADAIAARHAPQKL